MITSRSLLKRHAVIGALLAAFAAGGCGAQEEPAAEAATSDAASDAAVAGAGSPSPSPDAVTSSESPEPPAETSEDSGDGGGDDGGEYESCADGACEVTFGDSIAFPLAGDWTVDAEFDSGGVQVGLTDPNGMGGGGGFLAEPGCTLAIRGDGGGSLSCDHAEPSEPDDGGFVAHLVELSGGTAVLHVALG